MITTENAIIDDDDEEEPGVEPEKEDEELKIETPFNPEKIKIQTRNIVVQQLMDRIKYGEIDLSPDFQRLRGIWDSKRKSRLIESLLLRIPIPVFYVAADDSDHWAVVDGVQRISTICDHINNQYELKYLEYLTQFNGKTYSQLLRSMQRRISETELVVNVISSDTPEEVKFNVFSRINTGGLKLNSQEIIHAMYKDPARNYLRQLADSEEFKQATGNSISGKRMTDQEFVLRFLIFYIKSWEKYKARDFQGNFGETMNKINQMNDDQRNGITKDFKKSMRASFAIFGSKAFRKPTTKHNQTSPINRSLFEIWSVPLARYSEDQIKTLISDKDTIQERFISLCQDRDFAEAITASTGTTQRVHKRFSAVSALLKEFI